MSFGADFSGWQFFLNFYAMGCQSIWNCTFRHLIGSIMDFIQYLSPSSCHPNASIALLFSSYFCWWTTHCGSVVQTEITPSCLHLALQRFGNCYSFWWRYILRIVQTLPNHPAKLNYLVGQSWSVFCVVFQTFLEFCGQFLSFLSIWSFRFARIAEDTLGLHFHQYLGWAAAFPSIDYFEENSLSRWRNYSSSSTTSLSFSWMICYSSYSPFCLRIDSVISSSIWKDSASSPQDPGLSRCGLWSLSSYCLISSCFGSNSSTLSGSSLYSAFDWFSSGVSHTNSNHPGVPEIQMRPCKTSLAIGCHWFWRKRYVVNSSSNSIGSRQFHHRFQFDFFTFEYQCSPQRLPGSSAPGYGWSALCYSDGSNTISILLQIYPSPSSASFLISYTKTCLHAFPAFYWYCSQNYRVNSSWASYSYSNHGWTQSAADPRRWWSTSYCLFWIFLSLSYTVPPVCRTSHPVCLCFLCFPPWLLGYFDYVCRSCNNPWSLLASERSCCGCFIS